MRMVDGAAMDYLLIEMVHTLRASSAVATARSKKTEQEMVDAGLIPPPPAVPPPLAGIRDSQRDSMASTASGSRSGSTKPGLGPLDEEDEAVRSRLETIGLHVGANFTER